MKCVRIVGQGVPVRLSDEDAFQIVERDLDGEYCSKSFWKQWYDERPEDHPHRKRLYSRINAEGRLVEREAA